MHIHLFEENHTVHKQWHTQARTLDKDAAHWSTKKVRPLKFLLCHDRCSNIVLSDEGREKAGQTLVQKRKSRPSRLTYVTNTMPRFGIKSKKDLTSPIMSNLPRTSSLGVSNCRKMKSAIIVHQGRNQKRSGSPSDFERRAYGTGAPC